MMSAIKPFYMNDGSVLVNLSTCKMQSIANILDSNGFFLVLESFFDSITKDSKRSLFSIKSLTSVSEIILLFKQLLVLKFEDVINLNQEFNKFLDLRDMLVIFIEELYDYWRNFERYGVIERESTAYRGDNYILVDATTKFWHNVLTLYRQILSKLLLHPSYVYRQTPGGFNAGFIVSKALNNFPIEYNNLYDINVVNAMVIRTPFICHSKSNTRSGLFKEISINQIANLSLTKRHWMCLPIKIGDLLAYVYFHRTLLHHAVALGNLFEISINDYFSGKKPNIVYVYGSHEEEYDKSFYIDKKNDIYVGYVSRINENDYFGYMKKMLLTLHNVYMINHNKLPIHGAMVNIVFKDDKQVNIAIIGDSGAGKSESLEALRFIADKRIKEMNIIFDDMGIFYIENNKVYAKGTEIGAFIRLDDLDTGYAYKELDRAIFMNPERNNARVVLPITDYNFITCEHKVDYLFYANNYEDSEIAIKQFTDEFEALRVFKEGKRKAKGTTQEEGVVTSFFANPFGVLQLQKQSEILIDEVFKKLFINKEFVGELYTKLAINGKENKGITSAAKAILDLID